MVAEHGSCPRYTQTCYPWKLKWDQGFTRQPENSKRAHLRVPALQTLEKERKWDGRWKKSATFWATRLRPPTLRAPTLSGPTIRAPTLPTPTLGALTFSGSGPPTLRAPTPSCSTLRPPSLRAEPSGPPLFLGLGPYVLHFYHVAHLFFFCAFLTVSISCHFCFFCENFTVFYVVFSSWRRRRGGGQTQTPN